MMSCVRLRTGLYTCFRMHCIEGILSKDSKDAFAQPVRASCTWLVSQGFSKIIWFFTGDQRIRVVFASIKVDFLHCQWMTFRDNPVPLGYLCSFTISSGGIEMLLKFVQGA